MFYDALSDAYDVLFSTQPFGRPRPNPFQPVKWQPSMDADKLDPYYSTTVGGRIIPGVNTYQWNTRMREARGGMEEVTPDCDLVIDSSGSTPNPTSDVSLFVLAGFVVAKKAHRKGAYVRATNFSGQGQFSTTGWTRNLESVFNELVTHYNGGTYFPNDAIVEGRDPRQVVIITDADIANSTETAQGITKIRSRNPKNRIAMYAIRAQSGAEEYKKAGAQIVKDTTTNIFKRVIGDVEEVYT
jgi:hypothetical protein